MSEKYVFTFRIGWPSRNRRHRAAVAQRVTDRAGKEAEDRGRDRRDDHSEQREQRGSGLLVRHRRERDHRDRIAEAADRLSEPEETEVAAAPGHRRMSNTNGT